eukprot:gene1342-22984_t
MANTLAKKTCPTIVVTAPALIAVRKSTATLTARPKTSAGFANQTFLGPGVVLTPDFASFNDASRGPLKVGDVGVVQEDDRSNSWFNVEFEGTTWWYDEGAITLAPTDGKYFKVRSQTCAAYGHLTIFDPEICQAASTYFQFADTSVRSYSNGGVPSGCYHTDQGHAGWSTGLIMNPGRGAACSDSKVCLCQSSDTSASETTKARTTRTETSITK